MSTNARTENLGPGLRYRAAGVLRRVVFADLILRSMADWTPLEVWRGESSLPSDWPADDPRVPTEWGSLPVWFEGYYRGIPGRAPTTIPIYAADGTKVDDLRVVAWWNYNPEKEASTQVRPPVAQPLSPLPPVLPAPPPPPWAPVEPPEVRTTPTPPIAPRAQVAPTGESSTAGALALLGFGVTLAGLAAVVTWWRSKR